MKKRPRITLPEVVATRDAAPFGPRRYRCADLECVDADAPEFETEATRPRCPVCASESVIPVCGNPSDKLRNDPRKTHVSPGPANDFNIPSEDNSTDFPQDDSSSNSPKNHTVNPTTDPGSREFSTGSAITTREREYIPKTTEGSGYVC